MSGLLEPVATPDSRDLEAPTMRIIKAVKRRLRLRDFLRDRQVIGVLARRDFKVKYKQSLLGPLWLIFQPLALLAAFLVAFQGLSDVQPGTSYIPFVLVGLSVWTFFQASMTIGAASIITNALLVRFTPCPRQAFPAAAIIASLPAYGVTIGGALVAAVATGSLSPKVVLLPLALVWLFLLIGGFVGIASALTVRYRDLLAALPFLLQVGLFLAPVGYPLHELSDTVRGLVGLNPLTGVIEASRWMMLDGYHPSFEPVGVSMVLTPIVAWMGWRIFSRLEISMADEI